MDGRRRLIVALAGLAAVIAVWGLASVATRPALGLLYAGLDPSAAGGVVSALEARGVAYEVRGDSIYVEEGQRDALRLALAADGQPQTGAAGYELLDGLSGFGTTAQMFDAAYWRAKEGELARTLLAIPQVRRARVHIANPVRRPFEPSGSPTASVSVSVGAGALGEPQARAIRYLVASAVAGLSPGDVTVVDAENGTVLSEEQGPLAAAGGEDRSERLRQNIERLLEARVGRGAAVVEVMVDADLNSETVKERVLDPQSRVAIHSDTQESSESSQGENAGVTVASNLPDGETGGGGSSSNASETRERVNYEVSEVLRESVRNPGAIRKITVAVLVDGVRVPGAGGEPEWAPRPEEELAALRELVESAIGFDAARGDVVTIRSLEFTLPPDLGTEAVSGAGDFLAANAMSLIQLGVLSAVALLLGLFVLRPMLARQAEDADLLELQAGGEALAGSEGLADSIALAGEVIDARGVAAERIDALRGAVLERPDDTAALLGEWLSMDETREPA
ncbi:flagellar basal-body MS-ring/collar protein FliF [Albimonas donghaensis]|uniref:flagellar basal-body MS-ring/collar protein FliF n=1 Tax=Albimonas donghaensis TaxID=356660 RepID=UPI001C4094FD|nr:flagellar basal-body MS-ring/collar protein FliF [Albimonas donghaensis]